MPHENQPTAWRSLMVGALIGSGVCALLALLAGCEAKPSAMPSDRPASSPGSPLTLPQAPAVILAVESQQGARVSALAAVSPIVLTVSSSPPPSISAAAPVVKRGTLRLAWSAGPDDTVTGFRLYYGTNSGQYYASANVGNVTGATLTGLEEGTLYFIAATSYDAAGMESLFSNEASGTTPIFVSLGTQAWRVSAYGIPGKTNLMQATTNLVNWETIRTWVGNGTAVDVIHTNRQQSWFRVEVKP